MGISIADNFNYQGAKPLDARIKYATVALMKAQAEATLYDGCVAYVDEDEKMYQYKSSNTVDTTTGKWREFTTGGGSSSGGHTIEDAEGTALTQRATMQFGVGFNATDDSENEKTVVEADVMQSGDIDEVVTPLPSFHNPLPVLFDEGGNETVIGWYKFVNGTKKPVYEKMIELNLPASSGAQNINTNVDVSDVEKFIEYKVIGTSVSNHGYILPIIHPNVDNYNFVPFGCGKVSNENPVFYVYFSYIGARYCEVSSEYKLTSLYAIVHYTKTTDIAE